MSLEYGGNVSEEFLKISLFGDWAPENIHFQGSLPPSDVWFINLEGPVFSDSSQTLAAAATKAGPHLSNASLPDSLERAENLGGLFCLSLANNHLMDYGVEGLRSTYGALSKSTAKFAHSGAGETLDESRSPFVLQNEKSNLVVYSVCEPQFGAATFQSGGVAAVGPWLFGEIYGAKTKGATVGVSFHGGQEDIPIPSPARVELFRSLIDSGADFVWGHHSHVPQVWEFYRGKLIAYGLGNFVVDPKKWGSEPAHTRSITFEGLVDSSGAIKWTIGHTHIEDLLSVSQTARVHISVGLDEDLKRLATLSDFIQDPASHHALWQEFAFLLYEDFGKLFMGWKGPNFRRLAGRVFRSKKEIQIQQSLLRYHMLRNHAHREMLEEVLGVMSTELTDYRNFESNEIAVSIL